MFKTILDVIIAIPKIIAMIQQVISWVSVQRKESESRKKLEEAQKKFDDAITKDASDADVAQAAEDLLNGGNKK